MRGKPNSILITGGAGFVGSHVAHGFLEKGCNVTVYDNLSRASSLGLRSGSVRLYNVRYLQERFPKVRFLKGRVEDSRRLSRAARGHDAIIHLAGQVAVTSSLTDPRRDFETNALGTFNALEAARLADAAVVVSSTNKVYGDNVNQVSVKEKATRYAYAGRRFSKGIPESFPTDHCGHSPYGVSKLAADLYAQDYARSYGLSTSIFRMSCVYGPRQFGTEDQGWVAWFVIAAVTRKPVTIYGDGKQVRDLLYVDDLAKAFGKSLERRSVGEVYNIGGGVSNTLSLLELVEILEKMTGRSLRLKFKGWRDADQKVYISDIRKAKERLGWRPRVGPAEGVSRLLHWVEQNRRLFEGYRKS